MIREILGIPWPLTWQMVVGWVATIVVILCIVEIFSSDEYKAYRKAMWEAHKKQPKR